MNKEPGPCSVETTFSYARRHADVPISVQARRVVYQCEVGWGQFYVHVQLVCVVLNGKQSLHSGEVNKYKKAKV